MIRTRILPFLLVTSMGAMVCRAQSPDDALNRIKAMQNVDESKIVKEFRLNYIGGSVHCPAYQNAFRRDLINSGAEKVSVIEIESITCRMKFILVFSLGQAGWRYLGTIPLDEKYQLPKYSLVHLRLESKPIAALLVTGNSFADATGYQQENTQIFAILGPDLRIVFNEPEHMSIGVPSGPTSEQVQMYSASQDSKFEIAKTPQDGDTLIEEARLVKLNRKSVIMHLEYSWVDAWKIFCETLTPPGN